MTEAPSSTDQVTGPPANREGGSPSEQSAPRRAWPWFVSILAALALLVGLVWAAGGFDYRTDLATRIAPGQTFTNGPYELTFTSATVQKTKNFDDQQVWTVVVNGTGRTTGDESIDPDDDLFVVKDARSGAYQEKSEEQDLGVQRSGSGGSSFTPGLAPVPYRLVYEFPVAAFAPDSTIIFVAWQLEWRDTSLLQVGSYEWASTRQYYRMDLPLKRLPDDLD